MDPHGGMVTADLVAWLNAAGLDFDVVEGPKLPDLPDRVGVVTRAGGVGLRLEGAYDGIAVQVRVRGAASDPSRSSGADAERMAWQVDAVLLGAEMPDIGGVPTLGFTRTGSPPTPDEDAGDRVVMACTYGVLAASVL